MTDSPDQPRSLSFAGQSLIVYDGICNLCDGSLQFVDKRDASNRFLFVPIQSETGAHIVKSFGFKPDYIDSFLLVEAGELHLKSTAWGKILKKLRQPWPVVGSMLLLVPRFIRDGVYELVGRNRYRWFGRKEVCDIAFALKHRAVPSIDDIQPILHAAEGT